MTRELAWYWLGRVDYGVAVASMEGVRARILAGEEDAAALLLCEHPPVVTLGRSTKPTSVTAPAAEFARRGVAMAHSSRGGDATYHGPGQLMVYPVVRLTHGVADHVALLAGALAEVAAALGVEGAAWRRDPAGLWLDDGKIAACGLHVHRGVAIHGFALNVATPPEAWFGIIPCGLTAMGVTSIAAARAARGLPPPPPVAAVAELAAPILCRALDARPVRRVCPFSEGRDTMPDQRLASPPPGTTTPAAPAPNATSAAGDDRKPRPTESR